MVFRSRAPLRIGLAGGGTDVSPYSDLYGGAILNATVSMYAYTTIEPRDDRQIVIRGIDIRDTMTYEATSELSLDGRFDIAKGVHNRIVREFAHEPLAYTLTTFVDAPPGSGMGTSSTLVVAILGAFAEWLKLPLGEYELAHLAYEIERLDLGMAGGKQDQYSAAFGGFNFMEFADDDKVIVNPLRIKSDYKNELQFNMLLYYTGTSRLSSDIIAEQIDRVESSDSPSIDAMHELKRHAVLMKEALLRGEIDRLGELLDYGWEHKKRMASGISNPVIEEIYETAKRAGASGGKISGAGGGGFMIFYCPGTTRYDVTAALKPFGGRFRRYEFRTEGLVGWSS